jgi:hypothetical protein
VTTTLVAAYVLAAQIESHWVEAKLKLTPGQEIELSIFRLFENPLQMSLNFKVAGCQQRPELGAWYASPVSDGYMRHKPGANVRIDASIGEDKPISFEAMPMSSYNCDSNSRELTTNLAVEPGVYRSPPPADTPELILHQGLNRIRLKVMSIGPPIVGAMVGVYIVNALRSDQARANVTWLWFGLFPFFFLFAQTVWLAVLLQQTTRPR